MQSTSFAAVSDEAAKAADAKAAWYNQRRLYRQLRKRKCTEFYRDKFEASKSNPRRLWNTVDQLLGRSRVPASSAIGVEAFQQFFVDKVAKVDAVLSTFGRVRPGVCLQSSTALTFDDVVTAVHRLPNKSSAAEIG